MRKIFSVLVLVLASIVGYAQQAETLTAVAGSCNVLSVSTPGGGEPGDFYVTALFNDISGQWIDSSVVAGYILWDVDGNRFNIDSVDYGGIIDLWVTDLDTAGTVATGIGAIVQENDNYPFWVAGISQGLNQIINAHMVQMIGNDIASGGGGGPALVYSEATLADTTTFWRDPDSHVNAYLGQWTRIAPDRQFMTVTDLKNNVNAIPLVAGEIVQVNGFSSNEGSARYLVAASIDTTNEFHVRDTTFFDLGGGKYAILSKKHNDYIYPEMVGAVGDGVADDTRALRILHFYADKIRYGFQKVYKTTAFVAIKPRQEVDLNQSRIEHYQNYLSPCFDAALADNAIIKNGHIQGMDTLINPETELPGFTGYLLYRPEVGNVWNQSGILAQDVDSLVVKNMVIHNYRQGISVNSQIYSGPPVNIWERDTDTDWQNGANWDGSDNNNRIYIRDCDLGENLFGLLGGGNKLIDIDGLIGDVQPPDTLPVTIFAPPHLVYITDGGNSPAGYCETFIGRDIVGLPSRNATDVSILKLASVNQAIVENLVVDSIKTALEFYGADLTVNGLTATRMYGKSLWLANGDGRVSNTAATTTRVLRNIHTETVNASPSVDIFGTGTGGYEIDGATFKYVIPDSLNVPFTGLNGSEAMLIRGDSNIIQNVVIDCHESALPFRQAMSFDGGNYNVVKDLICLNFKQVAQESQGVGNYVEFNASLQDFAALENYGTNERHAWDNSKIRVKAYDGIEIPVTSGLNRLFNFTRGQTVEITDGQPNYAPTGADGPDYPVYFRFIGDGIQSESNGFIGTAEEVEYPPFLPAAGDTATFQYYYEAGKFYLADRAERTYADNPYGGSNNSQSVFDSIYANIPTPFSGSWNDLTDIPAGFADNVDNEGSGAGIDSVLNISPSDTVTFTPQNGDLIYANFQNGTFGQKGFYIYEENEWKKLATISPPSNVIPPVISGLVFSGDTLTTSQGTWNNADTYAYQWYVNNSPVVADTTNEYVLSASDLGDTIRCNVIATNGDGSTVFSTDDIIVPASCSAPIPTGFTVEGTTSSTVSLSWDEMPGVVAYTVFNNFTGTTVTTSSTSITLTGFPSGTTMNVGLASRCFNKSTSSYAFINDVTTD